MTMEPGVGRHRPPGAGGAVGMRSMSLIGTAGILAMVVALLGWGLVSILGGSRSVGQTQAASSMGPIGAGSHTPSTDPTVSSAATATDTPTATSVPTSTAVPTSSATTTAAIGPAPVVSTTARSSSTTSTTTPPTTASSTPAPTIPWGVTNVTFTCTLTGKRVQAQLSFTSTETVTAVLRAGSSTSTKTGSGQVSLTESGDTPTADCWAVVDGHTIGTIPAT